jgi:uncharacterized protein (UPF0335 family)
MSTTDKLVFNLLDQHDMLGPIALEAADAIERLTRERDEARQWVEDVKNVQENANAEGYAEAKAHYEARIAELTRERDEAQRENMDMVWQRRSAEFRAKAAEARIIKLEAALDSLLRDQHGRL